MRAIVGGVFAATLLVAAEAAGSATYTPPKDEALEQRIQAEIEARDPEGAALFAKATEARDREDVETSVGLLEQVHARDPWFVHATRRLCGAESWRGNHDRALALCKEAYTQDPSPLDGAAYAMTLLQADKGTADNGTRALELAREAVQKGGDDYFVQLTFCQAALHMKDLRDVALCAPALRKAAPHDASALYFGAIDDAANGRLEEADRELEEAHANGLPDEPYARLHDAIQESRSPIDRWGPGIAKAFAGWLAAFALLLGMGAVLSAVTLRASRRVPTEASGHARGGDAILRRVYRVVLWLTCVYYYVSLPVLAIGLLVFGLGVVYACFAIGHVPIKLVLIVVVIVGTSLWAIAKSVFVRGKDEDPGEKLALDEHPELRLVLDEVAARIETRPVDAVYMTPGTDIAVTERGGLLRQIRGKSERCLILGVAVLDGMKVRELKAILAHEYGHFQNEDTAGGGLALVVRRSVMTMALHIVKGRAASVLNPAWWFVRGFHAVFLRISQGASRLQEVLADRWAAFAYGSEAFARGLTHVVQRSVRFDAHINATLGEVVPAQTPVANFYAFVPKVAVDPKKVEEAAAEAMARPASPYDSHPRPVDRIAWVTKIAASGPPEDERDAREAWSLLTGRDVLEQRMTDEVRSRLATRGIRVVPPQSHVGLPPPALGQ